MVPNGQRTSPQAQDAVRIPVFGEVLGYVGGTLSLAALTALVGESWAQLATGGQIFAAALVAAVLLGGGFTLSRLTSDAGRRLSNFLFFFGTGAAGFLFGLIATKSMGAVDARSYPVSQFPEMVGSFFAFTTGGLIWWFRRTSLQLVAATLALWSFVFSCVDYSAFDSTTLGLVFVVVGTT
jgi:hypothetical protein